jgi:integrase
VKLTDTEVRKARKAKTAYKMADGHGLFIQVQPNGTKLWRFAYRFGGKQKLLALGVYPVITLAAAREKHMEARRALAGGIDPAAQRKIEKQTANGKVERQAGQGIMFGDAAALWYEHWKGHKSAPYVAVMDSRLKKDILPAIGSRPIDSIQAPELLTMAKAIEARGAHAPARRALGVTSQVFRYAIAHGLAQRNPAADVTPSDVLKPVKVVNRARVEAKELPELLAAIRNYRGALTGLAMRLMAYTFVRTGELIGARWDEIDFDAARWNIGAERMKMDSPHIVPLSRQAVDLLKVLRQLNPRSEYVFPGRGKGHMSSGTILLALERLGYRGKMTGHGFRGVASTLLHEQGWPHDHIEIQLAHTPRNAVSAAYNHALYLPQRREMMQAWADYLEQLQQGADVINFRTA